MSSNLNLTLVKFTLHINNSFRIFWCLFSDIPKFITDNLGNSNKNCKNKGYHQFSNHGNHLYIESDGYKGYGGNTDCRWAFYAPGTKYMRVRINAFKVFKVNPYVCKKSSIQTFRLLDLVIDLSLLLEQILVVLNYLIGMDLKEQKLIISTRTLFILDGIQAAPATLMVSLAMFNE